MSDIFREVEEDVRRERLEKFWKTYGEYVIALGVLLLVGIGGYKLWQYHDATEREKASTAFVAAQRITNPTQAAVAFSDLSKDAPSGYGLLAQLSQANAMFASGQVKPALDLYKEIANQDKGAIGAVARLRAAWALADSAPRGDLETLLAPLQDPASAWRQMALEVLAFADYRAQKFKAAQSEYQELANDPQAPDALRARTRGMAEFLAAGAAADFGSVPPPAPVTPPGVTMPPAAPAQ